ncbi:MAG: universal stress protein [Desulfovibrionales bacterium]
MEKIIATAGEHQCDIIVMGTIGAGYLVGAIMGSTARRVLRQNRIPVFVIPKAIG